MTETIDLTAGHIRREGIDTAAGNFKSVESQDILKCRAFLVQNNLLRQCKQIIVSSKYTYIMFVYQTTDF